MTDWIIDFIIKLVIYTIIAVLVPYVGYLIWYHFFFKRKQKKKTKLMRELERIIATTEMERKEVMEIGETKTEITETRKPELKTIDEISVFVKAAEKVIFTDYDLRADEIAILRKKGLIRFHGGYYTIEREALKLAKRLAEKLQVISNYSFSDFEWELFEHGIRALGVIYLHETEGPILIPISDPFSVFTKLRINVTDLAMLDEESITIGRHKFILVPVQVTERREKEHTIIAEVVCDSAKEFLKRKSLEILTEATKKLGGSR